MKTLLAALLLLCAVTTRAQVANTATWRGNYFGILLPIGTCSNERLAIDIQVGADGQLAGRIVDWENVTQLNFKAEWPFFSNAGYFNSNVGGIGDTVIGKFSKTGVLKGSAHFMNGCRYTFTAWRRYKVAI